MEVFGGGSEEGSASLFLKSKGNPTALLLDESPPPLVATATASDPAPNVCMYPNHLTPSSSSSGTSAIDYYQPRCLPQTGAWYPDPSTIYVVDVVCCLHLLWIEFFVKRI